VTVPLGFLVGRAVGLDLGEGVALGAVAALVDVAVVVGVTLAGARLLGRERRAADEIAHRRDGQRTGLVLDDGSARLAVSGRTDVLLRFAAPVRLERPLAEPLPVTELAIAVDDPARFVAAVQDARCGPDTATAADDRSALLAWFAPADLAEALA